MTVIAVLIKQVPDTTATINVQDGNVDESSIGKWSMSPYDEYALEAALTHAESCGGEVIAITMGPARADKMLKDAAAVGVKRLIRLWDDSAADFDANATAKALSSMIKDVGATVVYAGKASSDSNMGTTGPGVAELLGWNCVSHVSSYSLDEEHIDAVRIGLFGLEKVRSNLPGVVTCDKGLPELRRPNVKGIMMAKKASIETSTLQEHSVRVRRIKSELPAVKPAGKMFDGAESANDVVRLLREEAKVI